MSDPDGTVTPLDTQPLTGYDHPDRLVQRMEDLAAVVESSTNEQSRAITASLYGLVLDTAYALAASYHRVAVKQAPYHDSAGYFLNKRLKLHHSLTSVATHGHAESLTTELVGLYINAAQHFTHFLLDRLLNVLVQRAFDRHEQELELVYYNFVGMRVSLLRWRLSADGGSEISKIFVDLDKAFSRWGVKHRAGNCNTFVEELVLNEELAPNKLLDEIERAVRVTLGGRAGGTLGALAYIVDRTNEAKHLPAGAGRTQLARQLNSADGIRRMYEVEWALSFVAFDRVVDLLMASIRYLDSQSLAPTDLGSESREGAISVLVSLRRDTPEPPEVDPVDSMPGASHPG